MVKLLMRFYDVNSGSIKLDGHDVRDFDRHQLRESFGMVLQDTWLFEGTVRENLVYNKTGVTDQQLEEACRACGIYHFIETLPHGFDTVLDDSIAISSGQKQLLTIARAMIQGNPMLILDEATSSVDTRTELITQQAMDRLDLPVNLASGVARMELLGNRSLYIDRHRGVLAYSAEAVDINAGTVVVRVQGEGLELVVMTDEELRINGVIRQLQLVE